jgi:type II secretory ATPase GspE/PulE/Tfp pilus assembly ATPase PilB-like protein
MKLDDSLIKKILLDGSYITQDDVSRFTIFSQTHRVSFLEYLVSEHLISFDIFGQAVAEYLKVPYFDLHSQPPAPEVVTIIPEVVAKKFHIVVVDQKKNGFVVATDDPTQDGLSESLASLFPQKKITIVFSLTADIVAVFGAYRKTLETRFINIIKSGNRIAPEILNTVFEDAVGLRASDIHFEPESDAVLVRFRIDGVLRDVGRLSKEYYENILNRIKVQSGAKIDEHYAAQDGAMQYRAGDVAIDLRVSIVPTVEGEKVVLRVLGSYLQGLGLHELGFSKDHQHQIETSAQKPFGMILVVGPTGSGKTTTLYGLLKLLNQADVNITTIEDPVEYKMKGVNQIQVNMATDLSFARGLRSIVRQDPDIILVGEIRDRETAEIAVNAALTGHLLLSTFHANDAATAIPRLIDMGIEPFLLASTCDLIVAQRLVRRICDHCRVSVVQSRDRIASEYPTVKRFFSDKKCTLYEGKGCSLCSQSGYYGRTALFEMIAITPEMQNLILRHPSSAEIWSLAQSQHTVSMFEDGIEKVRNGVTTIAELLRVVEAPQ